ncbi:restriction endonuclease subunit S [Ruminococcus sp.]|uniref:restriction endonuclease subunit S n=1 Tax=Ruminococcus sp. TaxID=41978 RepID=UPI0025EC486E|nr:restriction endonuclease subunit S [Ruminococcus sp.]
MNQIIKQRIESINKGIVPEGYKKTKVGIVPVEWKQVKLVEIQKQRKTLMCVSEDAPLLSFTIEEGVIEPTDKKTNKRDFLIKDISTKKFALTEVGDIIYNPANLKFGAIHRNNLRKGVVSPIYGIFYGKQDSVFMGNLLHNQRFIDYAKIYTEGTVEKLKTLKAETFLKLKVVIPPLPEQQKIAEILSTQDKLIELQEKKIEQLKELKKAYLQKMFPKKGSKYPELRFKGFTDPWEQREFGELVVIERGGSPRPIDDYITDSPDGLNWVKIGDAPEQGNYITSTKEKIKPEGLSKTREVHPGDLILSNSMSFGKPYIMAIDGCIHDGWLSIKNTNNVFDLKFLCVLLGTDQMLTQYKSMAAGSTVNNLNKELVGNTTITYPKIEEQQTIGQFFEKIESLITLHQRKSEQEKQKKKALMQLLLTGKVRCK